tara:strand:- start:1251 stop:1910 length:660 start_codon:yes stop_codon:yes gene_type:complete
MALDKLKYNSFNVTPAASTAIRFNSDADGFETATAGGNLVKISATTLSSAAASISFTSGLTSTYKEYVFIFNNIHPATNLQGFLFNGSIDSGSNYNVTKTASLFRARLKEDDSNEELVIDSSRDSSQSTSGQYLNALLGNENDSSLSGVLHLFDPSNTTFVKHFLSITNEMSLYGDSTVGPHNVFSAGYFNTTSAIDAVNFAMESGNIDAGTITLYGVT